MTSEAPTAESPYVEYKEGLKYQLHADLVIFTGILGYNISTEWVRLWQNGYMVMYKGFTWDGASGPTIDTISSIRCSAGHDAGYQLIRLCLLPRNFGENFDDLLVEKGIEDGMWSLRAHVWERMLNYFGRSNLLPSRERHILRAP